MRNFTGGDQFGTILVRGTAEILLIFGFVLYDEHRGLGAFENGLKLLLEIPGVCNWGTRLPFSGVPYNKNDIQAGGVGGFAVFAFRVATQINGSRTVPGSTELFGNIDSALRRPGDAGESDAEMIILGESGV